MKFAASIVALAAAGALGLGLSFRAPAVASLPAPAAEGAFTIDSVHSAVIFKIKHMNVSTSWGRFNDPTGEFYFDDAHPEHSSVQVSVDVEKIDTANAKRDGHLRSPDFFAAKEYPTISFTSTSVKKAGEGKFEVTGNLNLKGKTKEVTVVMTKVGEGPGMGGATVSGYDTTLTIKRTDFGIDYGTQFVGDEVTLHISLEGGRGGKPQ